MIARLMGKPTWKLGALTLAALIQLGILASLVISQTRLLTTGREVVVAIVPVDPRDLFRGDYVTLAFSISTIPSDLVESGGPAENRAIFVTLQPGADGLWQATNARRLLPSSLGADQVVIRGHVTFGATPQTTSQVNRPGMGRSVGVRYGLERYYVAEGTGTRLETLARDKKLAAILAVGPTGQAAIKGLMVDGQRVYDEPVF
jgi:uncharacterized membrane-anchored protein